MKGAVILFVFWSLGAFAQPLLLLQDQQITRNITGSPEDDGQSSGCVVQSSSDDWLVQGFDGFFNACSEACALWAVSVQSQTVRAAYEEGCTDPGPLTKAIYNEIVLSFDIINTLETAAISFPLGGTTIRSYVSNREGGVLEQQNYIFLQDTAARKLAGNAYTHAKSSGGESITGRHLEYLFPRDNLGSFPDPWETDLTVSAGGLKGQIDLVMRADDVAEAYQFNDIAAIDEYPLYPGRSVATSRIQALIAVGSLDGVSPNEPDGDGDYWVDILDNCTTVANTDQRDPDGDGFGAICDGDFDNDGIVDQAVDGAIFQDCAFSVVGDPDYNPDVDMDGDGDCDSADLVIWRDYIGLPPGPSGRAP